MLCKLLGLPMTSHLSVFPLCSPEKSLTFKDTVRCLCGILGDPRIYTHMKYPTLALQIHPRMVSVLESASERVWLLCYCQAHLRPTHADQMHSIRAVYVCSASHGLDV